MLGKILLIIVIALVLIWFLNSDSFSLHTNSRGLTQTAAAAVLPSVPCASGTCGSRAPVLPVTEAPQSSVHKKANRRRW